MLDLLRYYARVYIEYIRLRLSLSLSLSLSNKYLQLNNTDVLINCKYSKVFEAEGCIFFLFVVSDKNS